MFDIDERFNCLISTTSRLQHQQNIHFVLKEFLENPSIVQETTVQPFLRQMPTPAWLSASLIVWLIVTGLFASLAEAKLNLPSSILTIVI